MLQIYSQLIFVLLNVLNVTFFCIKWKIIFYEIEIYIERRVKNEAVSFFQFYAIVWFRLMETMTKIVLNEFLELHFITAI